MTLLLSGALCQQGAGEAGGFDIENDITWHSLWWADGTAMTAEAYDDDADVHPWPNETGEADLTQGTASWRPHFKTSVAALNNRSGVYFDGSDDSMTSSLFTTAPTYPISIVMIGELRSRPGWQKLTDGFTSSTRNAIYLDSSGTPYLYSGSSASGASDSWGTGAFGAVAYFSGAGSPTTEKLLLDSVQEISGAAGTQELTALCVSRDQTSQTVQNAYLTLSVLGVYEGYIPDDSSWSDMQTWSNDYYGITI